MKKALLVVGGVVAAVTLTLSWLELRRLRKDLIALVPFREG